MKIPVFSGLAIGHGDLQWPLLLGVAAQLNLGS
jgi:muramoyltetrapeptide carboxypeptidase LdcA involved in peptidoglycan recycling